MPSTVGKSGFRCLYRFNFVDLFRTLESVANPPADAGPFKYFPSNSLLLVISRRRCDILTNKDKDADKDIV